MVSLYLDPTGEKIFSHSLPTNHQTHTMINDGSLEETISGLRVKIRELESKLVTQEVGVSCQ